MVGPVHLRIVKNTVPHGLGSRLTAVQSLCDQREQLRRRGELIEDQYVRAISQVNDSAQIKIAQH
jgi:hypothetical protein